MNNIKLLYNVFKTMKDKDAFKGALNVEAVKKGEKVLSLNKEFETNTATGEGKIKINTEANIDGNKVKSENTVEFNIKDCKLHKFHEMHHHGMKEHFHGMNTEGNEGESEHCGIKHGLNRITFMLNILSSIKSEEKENGLVLYLDLKDILKSIKTEKLEGCRRTCKEGMEKGHEHHAFMKELFSNEYEEAYLNVWVNRNSEVEKVVISAKSEEDTSFNAAMNLVW